MATKRQVQAAKQNVKKAQQAARRKRTISPTCRRARARSSGSRLRRAVSAAARPGTRSRTGDREQLHEIAKKQNIPGRSKMGKWDLIDAIRKWR